MSTEGKAKVLTSAEFKRVVRFAAGGRYGERNVAILHCSFYLGLRSKEIAALSIGDVFNCKQHELWDRVIIRKAMTKGERNRTLYLSHAKLCTSLLDYLASIKPNAPFDYRPGQPLFRTQKGSRFSAKSMVQCLAGLYEGAGIVGASSHSGRRTFATRLIEKGADIKTVQTLLGHERIETTLLYIESNPIRLSNIQAQLAI